MRVSAGPLFYPSTPHLYGSSSVSPSSAGLGIQGLSDVFFRARYLSLVLKKTPRFFIRRLCPLTEVLVFPNVFSPFRKGNVTTTDFQKVSFQATKIDFLPLSPREEWISILYAPVLVVFS